MSSTGIAKPSDFESRVIDVMQREEQQYIQRLKATRTETGGYGENAPGDSIGSNPREAPGNSLLKRGDTMGGPISYAAIPVAIIEDGSVNQNTLPIGANTLGYGGYIKVSGLTPTTDLHTLSGIFYPGQDIFMQGTIGQTIVIKDTGNIVTPLGGDFNLVGNSIIKLIYDFDTSFWIIYTAGSGSGGGGGGGNAANWKAPARVSSLFTATITHDFTGNYVFIQGVVWGTTTNLVPGDRILLIEELPATERGLWEVTSDTKDLGGTQYKIIRPSDFDTDAKVTAETFVAVEEGFSKDTLWHLITDNPIVLASTDQVWDQLQGQGDNLGNHIATEDLQMRSFDITDADRITLVSGVGAEGVVRGYNTSQMYNSKLEVSPGVFDWHMTFNTSLKSFIWTNSDTMSAQLDQSTFEKVLNGFPSGKPNTIQLNQLALPFAEGDIMNKILFLGQSTGLLNTEYAQITNTAERIAYGGFEGGLSLGVAELGINSPVSYISLNPGGDHKIRMRRNVDMGTWDIEQLDRLRFVVDSGVPKSNDDPSIWLSFPGQLNFNIKKGDFMTWRFGNVGGMTLHKGDSGADIDDIVLALKQGGLPRSNPELRFEGTNPHGLVGGTIGRINWVGTTDTDSNLKQYAYISATYGNRDNNNRSVRMNFLAYKDGAPVIYMGYNDVNNGFMNFYADIHTNAHDLLFRINPDTGFKSVGDTILGYSLGSEVWRYTNGLWRFASDMKVDLKNSYVDIDERSTPPNPSAGTRTMFVDPATEELSVRREDGVTVSLESGGGGGGGGDSQQFFVKSCVDTRGANASTWLNNTDGVFNNIGDHVLFINCDDPMENGIWQVTGLLYGNVLMTLERAPFWTLGVIMPVRTVVQVNEGYDNAGAIYTLDNSYGTRIIGLDNIWFTTVWQKPVIRKNGIWGLQGQDSLLATPYPRTEPAYRDLGYADGINQHNNGGLAALIATEENMGLLITDTDYSLTIPRIFHVVSQFDLDSCHQYAPWGMTGWYGDRAVEDGYGPTPYISSAGSRFNGIATTGGILVRINGLPWFNVLGDSESLSISNDYWANSIYMNNLNYFGDNDFNNNPPLKVGDLIEVFYITHGSAYILEDIAIWLIPQKFDFHAAIAGNAFAELYAALPPSPHFQKYKNNYQGKGAYIQYFHWEQDSNDQYGTAWFNGMGWRGTPAWTGIDFTLHNGNTPEFHTPTWSRGYTTWSTGY